MRSQETNRCVLALSLALAIASTTSAQSRVRFSTPTITPVQYQPPPGTAAPVPPATTVPGTPVPGGTLQSPTFAQPATTVPGATGAPPAGFAAPVPGATAPPAGYAAPTGAAPGQPYYSPPAASVAPTYPGTTAAPAYPGYPAQPPTQFPGGVPWAAPAVQPMQGPYQRLFDDFRIRYTWISGDAGSNGNDLGINDFEGAVSMVFPNFLHSGEPLQMSPGFILHLWSGPAPPFSPPSDLPSNAYSAYLEFDWITNQQRRFGGEVDFTVGIYSDFNTATSQSLRFTGTGLLWYRITDTLTLKGGIEYFDRVRTNLLPAGGLIWTPNDDARWEIYFPRPKVAWRMTTWGNADLWWYIGAEYGGGSWTVQRTAGFTDQVDINDIRLFGGIEWHNKFTGLNGFVEAGWVTSRELVYKVDTASNLDLRDAFMLRAGLMF